MFKIKRFLYLDIKAFSQKHSALAVWFFLRLFKITSRPLLAADWMGFVPRDQPGPGELPTSYAYKFQNTQNEQLGSYQHFTLICISAFISQTALFLLLINDIYSSHCSIFAVYKLCEINQSVEIFIKSKKKLFFFCHS